MSCLIDQCLKINWDFLRRRGNQNLCCVSDEFEILQEKKPARDCDGWEKGSLTESIIACIEKEKALDPKVDDEKFDKAVRSSCFSTETGQ